MREDGHYFRWPAPQCHVVHAGGELPRLSAFISRAKAPLSELRRCTLFEKQAFNTSVHFIEYVNPAGPVLRAGPGAQPRHCHGGRLAFQPQGQALQVQVRLIPMGGAAPPMWSRAERESCRAGLAREHSAGLGWPELKRRGRPPMAATFSAAFHTNRQAHAAAACPSAACRQHHCLQREWAGVCGGPGGPQRAHRGPSV